MDSWSVVLADVNHVPFISVVYKATAPNYLLAEREARDYFLDACKGYDPLLTTEAKGLALTHRHFYADKPQVYVYLVRVASITERG